MKNNYLSLIACVVGAMILTNGCSSSDEDMMYDDNSSIGNPNSGIVDDSAIQGTMAQGDYQVGYDPDGAIIAGDPMQEAQDNYQQSMAGPQALRDNNIIYFRYDSEQIQDAYVGVMQAHAQYLRDNPDSRIIIEGHTDERGTPEYNIALGERRARSVARYMTNLGVDANQLSIVSYGEEKPVDPGHQEASWQKNRRAVINY